MAGGFGSYLIALDERTYKLIGVDYPGNRAEDVKDPGLLWMIGFIFVVSFLGLFSLVPLRKVYFVTISCFFSTANVASKMFRIQNYYMKEFYARSELTMLVNYLFQVNLNSVDLLLVYDPINFLTLY